MTDIATLQLAIDATQVKGATLELEKLSDGGTKTESTLAKLTKTAAGVFAGFKLVDTIKEATMLAARYETLGLSMQMAGKNAGYTRVEMENFQKGLEKTGISMTESRQQLIQMAAAHVNLADATRLARAAQDLAVVGAMNSSDAFAALNHGIQTGQTDVLRTLGLNVSFEESYKKLASQIGKTTASLSEQEKLQARTNATLDAAASYAGIYEQAMGTASKQIGSMTRYTENLKVMTGETFNEALTIAVMGLTSSLKDANGEVSKLKEQGQIKEWGASAKDAMIIAADAVNAVAMAFKTLAQEIAFVAVALPLVFTDSILDGFPKLRATIAGFGKDVIDNWDAVGRFQRADIERTAALQEKKDREAMLRKGQASGFLSAIDFAKNSSGGLTQEKALSIAKQAYPEEFPTPLQTPSAISGKARAGKDPDADAKRFLQSLKDETEQMGLQSEAIKWLEANKAALANPKYAKQIMAEANAYYTKVLSLKEASAAEQKAAEDTAAKAKAIAEANSILLDINPIAKASAEWEKLLRIQKSAVDADGKHILSLEQIGQAYAKMQGTAKTNLDEMTVFAQQAGKNIQDAFAQFLFDPFKGGLKGMLQGFTDMLRKIAAEKAAAQIMKSIGDWGLTGGGAGSTLGGIASAMFSNPSFAGGGYTGSGSRAGGIDGQGGFMAVLHPQETVVDHAKGQKTGGGITVVNNFTISQPTDRRTQEQIAAMAGASIQNAMLRNA